MGMPPGRGAGAKIDDATAIVVGRVIRDDGLSCPCHRSPGPSGNRGGLAQRFFLQCAEFNDAHSFYPPYPYLSVLCCSRMLGSVHPNRVRVMRKCTHPVGEGRG
jgi:hypothetical protein